MRKIPQDDPVQNEEEKPIVLFKGKKYRMMNMRPPSPGDLYLSLSLEDIMLCEISSSSKSRIIVEEI